MLTLLSIFAWIIATVAWVTLLAPMGDARAHRLTTGRADGAREHDAATPAPIVAARWRPAGSWGGTGRTEL